MSKTKNQVCPVEKANSLDTRWRRCLTNPRKILKPYLKEGMKVLDIGCGPGFFSIDMADMIGKSGHIIAADLQEGMLEIVRNKTQGTDLEDRITLHSCEKDKIGVTELVDFVLAFYVVHEIPNKEAFFNELGAIVKPGGKIFIAEPPFHVSKSAFIEMINLAGKAGFTPEKGPWIFLNKTVVLNKIDNNQV